MDVDQEDQRTRDFMAASVVDSDLDLAFRLQLQEAMDASLAFQPSSSISLAQTQHPPSLISYDFQEFQTAKKPHVDFHLDQKRASQILHMPEEQRRVLGGNIGRPFGEGSSSSTTEVNSEFFDVYFKGLISEEKVPGIGSSWETVRFAGIGVAICNSRDECIFETRKPLDLSEDDRMTRLGAEGKALIEALNAAIALDLKKVVLCFDYFTLFQQVRGQWQPKQEKFRTIVNQVNLLRGNFTDFVPCFVARKNVKFAVKFAFKLAREAIVSQINKPMVSSHDKLENCVICLDDKSMNQFFSVEGCKHRYCFSCMKQHVEVKLLNGTVPKCPHDGCESGLKVESCKIFLSPKLIEMMKQQLKEASIPVTDKVYCPYPKCSALMSKAELLRLPRQIHKSGARTCYKCDGNFCINCRVPWHTNMSCAEYKRKNPTPLVEESKIKNLAAKNLWRQCVKCKHMIELAAGCYHMTCRCGYEFCHNCGAEWKNKKATCNCPLWVEQNIVNDDDESDDEPPPPAFWLGLHIVEREGIHFDRFEDFDYEEGHGFDHDDYLF